MLSNSHFYHRITRKLVVAFGTMFNNLKMVRYNQAGTTEIERITVPLSYAPKEKFYARLKQDPNLDKQVQITLPRMSFELTSITYDPLRKVSSFQKQFSPLNSTQVKSTYLAPYNFNFTLYIYVRNTEDGTQIIEQILPYFNPDYTLTLNLAGVGNYVDVPIIFQGVDYGPYSDTGSSEDLRVLQWTLTFSVKAYLYGPISNNKIIRKVTANTFAYNESGTGERIFAMSTGTGDFKIGELVYQGRTLEAANASGFVEAWDNVGNTLVIVDSTGAFGVGKMITGAVSNTSWNLASYRSATNYQLVNLTVTPDPNTANANTAFGFDVVIEEAPNIT